MMINKKIIYNYIIIFFAVVISSFFIINKLVVETLKKEDVVERNIIYINLSSNYENYTFNFRGDKFLKEIQKFSNESSVSHITEGGMHIVEIKIPNVDSNMINNFKKIINDSINLYNLDFDQCLENFQTCDNYHLRDEIISYIQFKNNKNLEKRIDQLICLINSDLTNCKQKIVLLIKSHFEPINVSYNFIDRQNQNKKEINNKKLFLLTNSIMFLFITAVFIISSPILFLLTKKRL